MTLVLRLTSVTGSKQPDFIYVDGGQSGGLKVNTSKLPQSIKCSKQDHLQFILCGKHSDVYPKQEDVFARRDFWAQATIDQNREIWDDGKQHEYKFEYYNQKHEKLGELVFQATYTRGLFYQGEIQGAGKVKIKYLPFYKSSCPTYNLYNCLDSKQGTPTFNFIEDIYRDQVQH